MPENNDKQRLQDLYNEYNIPLPEEERPVPSRRQTSSVNRGNTQQKNNIPRKPDGTEYTLQELQQIQAYRAAMRQRQLARQAENSSQQSSNVRTQNRDQQRPVRQHTQASDSGITPNRQPSAARPANVQRQNAAQPKYRRRKLSKPNPAALIFALLIVVISAVSIGQIIENNRLPAHTADHSSPSLEHNNDDTLNSLIGSETTGETETAAEEDLVLWNTIQVSNGMLDEGNLILVNYEHAYANTDTISPVVLYGIKADTYQISNTNISLLSHTLDALNTLANDFYATSGSRELIIVSGYRDVASQQSIYDSRVASEGEEMAKLYVAVPGHSEHHTGLAIDMSFYTTDGKSISVEEHEYGYWIHENCANYGFIVRYPDHKVDITKIGYESWHYRYVGLPHATIMTAKDLCLEEYIDYLREYTTSNKLIWIQNDGSQAEVSPTAFPKEGTLVYYVPAEEGEVTNIRLPRGNIFNHYDISGNNVDGFIVTIYIG